VLKLGEPMRLVCTSAACGFVFYLDPKVAVGTIKSRVGRARAALTAMIEEGQIPERSIGDPIAHRAILEELDEVAAGRGLAIPTK